LKKAKEHTGFFAFVTSSSIAAHDHAKESEETSRFRFSGSTKKKPKSVPERHGGWRLQQPEL
jgi:hypothetical protein